MEKKIEELEPIEIEPVSGGEGPELGWWDNLWPNGKPPKWVVDSE